MFGTVMTGRLRGGVDELQRALKDWETERKVPGYIDAQFLLADDGITVVETVRFTTREAYEDLANDPEQARWWEARVAPLLEGDPTWVDGTWFDR